MFEASRNDHDGNGNRYGLRVLLMFDDGSLPLPCQRMHLFTTPSRIPRLLSGSLYDRNTCQATPAASIEPVPGLDVLLQRQNEVEVLQRLEETTLRSPLHAMATVQR